MPANGDGELELDQRNAALLVDERRRKFLAHLDRGMPFSYAVLWEWQQAWVDHATMAEAAQQRPDFRGTPRDWETFRHRWLAKQALLMNLLELSGSLGGRRSQQIVEALTAERGGVSGPEVFFQMTGAAPKEAEPRRGWLFKR